MIKEALEHIQKLMRPSELMINERQYLYSDCEEQYKRVLPNQTRDVSNIDSFVDIILEEARRTENDDGDWMTVIVKQSGGKLFVDDKKQGDIWTYSRCYSNEWHQLMDALGDKMSHLEFVRWLQSFQNAVIDYPDLARLFRSVSLDSKSTFASAPTLNEGKTGLTVDFSLEAKGDGPDKKVSLPSEIRFFMPITRGSKKYYRGRVNYDITVEPSRGPVFTLAFPEKDMMLDQLLKDEYDYVVEKVKPKLKDICILQDY